MNSVEDRPHQEKSAPLIYRLQCWFFVLCIVGGTAVTLVSVVANPGYYSPHTDVASFIAAFATANAFMSQTHVISLIFVSYLLPLGLLAMAWLALRRAPGGRVVLLCFSFLACFPWSSLPVRTRDVRNKSIG